MIEGHDCMIACAHVQRQMRVQMMHVEIIGIRYSVFGNGWPPQCTRASFVSTVL